MTITPDQIQAALAIAGALGSAVAFAIVAIWKASKWANSVSTGLKSLVAAVNKTGDRLKSLEEKVVEVSTVQRERAASADKMEGKLELTTAALAASIKASEKTADKVEALWKTLQVLHPDRVPKRASDR